ncbi:MAG: hypothetical protein KDI83_17965 [Gammaproteobacteria bacterium]|nr:hypothetical protein [Gammaproteobacteria bacterium]
MKGDFSNLYFRPGDNYSGTLQQQGRVFSDQDANAADVIARHLRQLLGRDIIGPGVAGVPSDQTESVQVLTAESDGSNDVRLTLSPGRVWVDGLHLYVADEGPISRTATYFGPPIAAPTPQVDEIDAGVRDAVVLECWEAAFNAFQAPQDLLEPALGGPDTTERVVVHHRLRLLRLAEDERCASIHERLRDDPESQGRLSVTAVASTSILGDCPLQAGGGYTGFEHLLYRIEIAEPGVNGARFKYSRFNGGLVGRGSYDSGQARIRIRANAPMINLSQLNEFYLEVLAPGSADEPGNWQVTLSASASLIEGGDLLSLSEIDGYWPGADSDEAFIRLWDGIRDIDDFVGASELEQGIELDFDAPTADFGNYRPGDYWTFPVRAAGIEFDTSVWPNEALPQGVCYHRAPLAILNWDAPVTQLVGYPAIEDCRVVIRTLSSERGCCTFQVGDGQQSFGDFNRIQDAIDQLPPEGGEICVLAGEYRENLVIERDNVKLHGCGRRSRLVPDQAMPVVEIRGARRIQIEKLFLAAHEASAGIVVSVADDGASAQEIALLGLEVTAAADAAIKVLDAQGLSIRDCRLNMVDTATPWQALSIRAEEVLLEHNEIRVIPAVAADGSPVPVIAGRGGLHLAGTCQRVRVIDNLIEGGIDNGITLGTILSVELPELGSLEFAPVTFDWDPFTDRPLPGNNQVPYIPTGSNRTVMLSAGALYDIRIERNRIRDMGLAGIGVAGFFDLAQQDQLISVVGLAILGNEISGCLRRELAPIAETMRDYAGYGAVTLADVEQLRFHDNQILDNGPDHQYPVCGLFLLHGEGLDICRNRILNTGAKSEADPQDALPGRRGGIVIVYALPGLVELEIGGKLYPRQGGEPAARIHDNIVSQPLGQALYLQALGPVSVQGNQLTSRGLSGDLQDPSFWASTVWILNLGMSNELYLQTLGFSGVTADPLDLATLPEGEEGFLPVAQPGLDDYALGQYLANGNLLFSGNQVLTDLMELELSYAVSSVLLLSLDDVSVQDNQFDCEFLIDLMVTNLICAGTTLRINNNRFKESLFYAPFSWIGLGLIFNNASDNQSTHCFLNLKSPLGGGNPLLNPHIADHHNQVLYPYLWKPTPEKMQCEWVDKYTNLLLTKYTPSTDLPFPPSTTGIGGISLGTGSTRATRE